MSAMLLLQGGDLTPGVSRILTSTHRVDRMMNDIPDFARGQLAASMSITRTSSDLGEILCRVIDEIQTSNPGSTVLFYSSEKLVGQWDRQRLEQLASNLLNNAIQHGTREHIIAKGDGTTVRYFLR